MSMVEATKIQEPIELKEENSDNWKMLHLLADAATKMRDSEEMPSGRKRKAPRRQQMGKRSSKCKVHKRMREIKEGEKIEVTHSEGHEVNQAVSHILTSSQCIKGDISSEKTSSLRKKVKVFLPSLEVPDELFDFEENIMSDLQTLLRKYGFEVVDRPTLAFFVVGRKYDVHAAARCFLDFYKLVNSSEFKYPNCSLVEQEEHMEAVEGFARHPDGTLGVFLCVGKWERNRVSDYAIRKQICHLLWNLDLSMLRAGITCVVNLSGLVWRKFEPFKWSKMNDTVLRCVPLRISKVLFLDANFYASLAVSVLTPIISYRASYVASVLTSEEAAIRFPNVVLPPSVTGSTYDLDIFFSRLSPVEQMNMQFVIDC